MNTERIDITFSMLADFNGGWIKEFQLKHGLGEGQKTAPHTLSFTVAEGVADALKGKLLGHTFITGIETHQS